MAAKPSDRSQLLSVHVIDHLQSTAGAMFPCRPDLFLLHPGSPALGTLGVATLGTKEAQETDANQSGRNHHPTSSTPIGEQSTWHFAFLLKEGKRISVLPAWEWLDGRLREDTPENFDEAKACGE